MHPGQLRLTPGVVRRLVDAQFREWRRLPITALPACGTVNALFRVGDDLVARFALQRSDEADGGRAGLEAEAAAASELFGRTRFPTPRPVAIGDPGPGYPQAWAVQTWLPGTTGVEADPGGSVAFAYDLAELVSGLRAIDTAGRTFAGTGRGGDLGAHDDWMAQCFVRSARLLDVPRLRMLWDRLRELPRAPGGDVMSHGDLMPGNVLVSRGRLTGVLDVGGFGPADPALDLMAAWNLLHTAPRRVFRAQLGVDDLTWQRGVAWAFEQAMGLVWYYERSNPTMSLLGQRTLGRILAADEAAP